MKSLCSPLSSPILRALEWALNRKAVYVYDFDGQRHLRLAYRIPETGWGVTIMGMRGILSRLTSMGWSADNIAFGMGGGLLQKVNRDTFKFAMKASWRVDAEGTGHPVVKNPKTDQTKKSKSGILTLVKKGDQMVTQDKSIRLNPGEKDLLVPVYSRNKQDLLHIQQKFQEVREKAAL